MLTNVRTLFGVAYVTVMALSSISAAPLETVSLDRRGLTGQACLSYHEGDLCAGSCGPNVNPAGRPCVAIPQALFASGFQGSDPNQNPKCGREIKLTLNGKTLNAVVAGGNVEKADQDCGIGAPGSVDVPRTLFDSLGGTADTKLLPLISYDIA